jgi:hypothetical protein
LLSFFPLCQILRLELTSQAVKTSVLYVILTPYCLWSKQYQWMHYFLCTVLSCPPVDT